MYNGLFQIGLDEVKAMFEKIIYIYLQKYFLKKGKKKYN